MPSSTIVNAEHLSLSYGLQVVLSDVSLGLSVGDVIGVVGRNGAGKSSLLGVLVGSIEPDSGRVIRGGSVSIGVLTQLEPDPGSQSVRDLIVDGQPDHVWAADRYRRSVVDDLLTAVGIDLDAPLARLSGGERRRAALVAVMLHRHDLLVLDEPTNHLDIEAVGWLADHLRELQSRGVGMLVVSHDRWFLDAICTRIWEVHDAQVDAYDGGYAAYVLARVERTRRADAREAKRANLARKELAWLRHGPPARTSKPRFRIEAANALIADVPAPRDKLALQQFTATRLGKDVFDLKGVDLQVGSRMILHALNWSIGPGDRIGVVGVNGSGKSTLLRLLAGEQSPTRGVVRRGTTLRIAHLTQELANMDLTERVLDSVSRIREQTRLATGREVSATDLLEDFGFTGQRLVSRVGELSGGERRRLQFLRLLMGEPNVLLLDEPTNDLDIDTLNVIEDYLDTWPGTLIVASHDRYFLERVTDVTYALPGDGRCVLLPGGIDQYLTTRRESIATAPTRPVDAAGRSSEEAPSQAAAARRRAKQLARLESQLDRAAVDIQRIQTRMAESASDYLQLGRLQAELATAQARQHELEDAWLTLAEQD